MGVTDVGFVDPSGGLEKLIPLIFQSDYKKGSVKLASHTNVAPTFAFTNMASGVKFA